MMSALNASVSVNHRPSVYTYMLRLLTTCEWTTKRYQDAWVFFWIRTPRRMTMPNISIVGLRIIPVMAKKILLCSAQKNTDDWRRLKKAKVSNWFLFGGLQHKLLLMNASWLFSSHAAPFCGQCTTEKPFWRLDQLQILLSTAWGYQRRSIGMAQFTAN
ncbi:hypothetical protein ACFS07_07450 [Undibacterium arcticum]